MPCLRPFANERATTTATATQESVSLKVSHKPTQYIEHAAIWSESCPARFFYYNDHNDNKCGDDDSAVHKYTMTNAGAITIMEYYTVFMTLFA